MVNNNLMNTIFRRKQVKTILFLFAVISCSAVSAQVKKNNKTETDTFKIANQYIAKKKFRKADKVLKKYRQSHPKDINAAWLQAQNKLYLNNFKQSDILYQSAVKMQRDNDYLQLDYVHSSADMGKMTQAENLLSTLENAGKDYSNMSLLHARLSYYQGDYKLAAAYMKKAVQLNANNNEASTLNDEIE